MRPALLVIIMDFLVSSLLLFIPDSGETAGGSGPALTSGAYAEAFSPGAMSDMEFDWAREYQEQLKIDRLSLQDRRIDQLQSEKQDIASARDELRKTTEMREREIQRQRDEIAQRQIEIDGLKTRTIENAKNIEDANRAKAGLQAEIERRNQTIASQQQSISTLSSDNRRLEDIASKQIRLAEAAGEIHKSQTNVESKLNTLQASLSNEFSTLQKTGFDTQVKLDGIAESQQTLDRRLSEISNDQRQMAGAIRSFQTYAEKLSGSLGDNAQTVADTQARIENSVASLSEAVAQVHSGLSSNDVKAIAERLATLATQQRQIELALRQLSTGDLQRQAAYTNLLALRQQQESLQSDIRGVAERVEQAAARKPGPHKAVRLSRLELRGSFIKSIDYRDGFSDPYLVHNSIVYAPVVNISNTPYLAVNFADAGLNWRGLRGELIRVNYAVYGMNTNANSLIVKGPLLLHPSDPRIILVPLSSADGGSLDAGNPLYGIPPLPIMSRDTLDRRGLGDIFLYKRGAEGFSFAVETTFDMTDPRYLVVKGYLRNWASAVRKVFVSQNARPETGDYLVTAEGQMIGVLVSPTACLILGTPSFDKEMKTIPLDKTTSFSSQVELLRHYWR